jgi:hypothetical protein
MQIISSKILAGKKLTPAKILPGIYSWHIFLAYIT